MTHTTFSRLRVNGWRQFGSVELDFHPRLTVITGANGAGKSSLLKLLNRHFSFESPFLATPVRDSDGQFSYVTGIFGETLSRLWNILGFDQSSGPETQIGELRYQNGETSKLVIPKSGGVQFKVKGHNKQNVRGIHIDSHAEPPIFKQVAHIPADIITPQKAYNSYNNEINAKYSGNFTGFSTYYRMKEAIIAMALFGEGNKRVDGNPDILSAYNGFVDSLRGMMPPSLGFMDIAVRPPEVVLITKSGEFLIDAASGGIMTIIDLTWRLYMFSLSGEDFVVTLDEPENHLHPTMQRSLLRNLIKTFPQAQFVIATHSPFMVSSVKDSTVHVLRYKNAETGEMEGFDKIAPSSTSRVFGEKLDHVNRAGSASDILRQVLGVPVTIPEWVEENVDSIVKRYQGRKLSPELLDELRNELRELGYEGLYSQALQGVLAADD
ncbi:AAA family ATPase [Maricaulis sp.]|uniref:AAA family ATPase n=3 Tax=Alphaproteobacteria TaxID=28211 RepID=UPI003299FB39